jgi:hypothetical protein
MPDQNGGKPEYYKILVISFLCWDRRPDIELERWFNMLQAGGFSSKDMRQNRTIFFEGGFAATRVGGYSSPHVFSKKR